MKESRGYSSALMRKADTEDVAGALIGSLPNAVQKLGPQGRRCSREVLHDDLQLRQRDASSLAVGNQP